LISDHLADLQQHKLPHLSKQIGIEVDTLMAELQFIRTLDPYPGRRYSSEEPVLIAPEIYIEKLDADDEDYVIYFSDDGSPRLRLSPQYSRDARSAGSEQRDQELYKKDAFRGDRQ
jgi:RNA polymerase sigma-54 factor